MSRSSRSSREPGRSAAPRHARHSTASATPTRRSARLAAQRDRRRLLIVGAFISLIASSLALLGDGVGASATQNPPRTLYPAGTVPAYPASWDSSTGELGIKFTVTQAGAILGVRFYKSSQNVGVHTGSLWDTNGKRLATATFTDESTQGWQQVTFANPVQVKPGISYTASYHTTTGHYAIQPLVFWRGSHLTADGIVGLKGVYARGATQFPTDSWFGSSFFVDISFQPADSSVSRPAPTATAAPASTPKATVAPTPSPKATATAAAQVTPKPTVKPTVAPIPQGSSATPAPAATSVALGFPSTSNTGPTAAGYTGLTTYTGPTDITKAGTVITGKIINSPLTISAANVTVEGNIIHAANTSPDAGGTPIVNILGDGAKVLNNDIGGVSATAGAKDGVKIYADNVTFSGNNVHWIADDGITIEGNNMVLQNNWMHDFVYRSGVHFDGLVYDSSTTNTVLIQHNTLDMWLDQGGMNHTVNLGATAPHITVHNNLIAGGGWTVSGGATYSNNVFSQVHSASCGSFGTHAYTDNATWLSNVWASGVSIPL